MLFLAECILPGMADVSPSTEIKYDDLFSYKNGFKDQLTGIYTTLCSENLYGVELGFGMLDVLGQQYYLWSATANGSYYNMHRFEYDNSKCETIINSIWTNTALNSKPTTLPSWHTTARKNDMEIR